MWTRWYILLSLVALVTAHDEPTTPEEISANRALQESFYHCAPVIDAYTAMRKRSWTQKVLGGTEVRGELDDARLLLEKAFQSAESGKKMLACHDLEEPKIKNNTCVLSPVVTQGPYYHTEGHPIRQNMAEDQLGQLFFMDIGVLDVETCKPVEGILVDLWHANATGHYAGHADPSPHLIYELPTVGGKRHGMLSAFPRWNTEETWLRAAWPTDHNGLAQFTSIFPGYYTGRATHVHIKVHTKWDTLPNGTFTSGNLIYTGQFFVDDGINMQVDKIWPYNLNPIANKWGRTRNWDDNLEVWKDSHRNGFGPVFDIQKLGGIFTQGHIGYITVGVNMSHVVSGNWSPERPLGWF